jgi:type IV pilus assembly protein PilB
MPLGEPIVVDLTGDEEPADPHPARKVVWAVLLQAVRDRATQVRFEPQEDHFQTSYEVNGDVQNLIAPPAILSQRIINAIKVMAELDFARPEPQRQGTVYLSVDQHLVEALVTVDSTDHGERALVQLVDFIPKTRAMTGQALTEFLKLREAKNQSQP